MPVEFGVHAVTHVATDTPVDTMRPLPSPNPTTMPPVWGLCVTK